MSVESIQCPNCGASMTIALSMNKATCMYCGTQSLIQRAINFLHVEMVSTPDSVHQLAQRYEKMGNLEEAISKYSRTIELQPDNWFALIKWLLLMEQSRVNDYQLEVVRLLKKSGNYYTHDYSRLSDEPILADLTSAVYQAEREQGNTLPTLRQAVANQFGKILLSRFRTPTPILAGDKYMNLAMTGIPIMFTSLGAAIDYIEALSLCYDWSSEPSDRVAYAKRIVSVFIQLEINKQPPYDKFNFSHTEKTSALKNKFIVLAPRGEDHEKDRNPNACFVATVAYGSYDAPQVQVLRRYRDTSLARTMHGRAFIRAYYALGPHLANLLKDRLVVIKLVRRVLDWLVDFISRRQS